MLEVFFLGRAPAELAAANIVITGGAPVQVTAIRVYRQQDTTLDDWMEVDVNQPGDFSTYTLAVVQPGPAGTTVAMTGFDPLYAAVQFSFKATCPTSADCLTSQDCPQPARTAPPIDYLAKDYASFRQTHPGPAGPDHAGLDRNSPPGHRRNAGRSAGLCRRPVELLSGCGGDRGVSGNRSPADFVAPACAPGRLPGARGLQCPRMGNDCHDHAGNAAVPRRDALLTSFPGGPAPGILATQ